MSATLSICDRCHEEASTERIKAVDLCARCVAEIPNRETIKVTPDNTPGPRMARRAVALGIAKGQAVDPSGLDQVERDRLRQLTKIARRRMKTAAHESQMRAEQRTRFAKGER